MLEAYTQPYAMLDRDESLISYIRQYHRADEVTIPYSKTCKKIANFQIKKDLLKIIWKFDRKRIP